MTYPLPLTETDRSQDSFGGEPPRRRRSKINWPVALAILVLAGLVAATFLRPGEVTERDRDDKIVRVVLPPPPPPPPPPEVQPEERPPEPTPTPMDQALDDTPPPPDAPAEPTAGDNALTAREGAGPSNYGLAAGDGSGTRIGGRPGRPSGLGGFNRAAYTSYLQNEIKRAVETDRSLRSEALQARARVWIDAGGRITRVEVNGSDRDAAIRQALVGRSVRPPDASLGMPVSLSLDIRRPR